MVIGDYLEGNYINMGGAAKSVGHEIDKFTHTATGGKGGGTSLESQGEGFDESAHESGKWLRRGPGSKSAFNAIGEGIFGAIDETTNVLAGDPRGRNEAARRQAEMDKRNRELAAAANAAKSAYGQDKGKKKKPKKGLLSLHTPSAKSARFRSGKRRFRVSPTGVSVAGSGGASVGTS